MARSRYGAPSWTQSFFEKIGDSATRLAGVKMKVRAMIGKTLDDSIEGKLDVVARRHALDRGRADNRGFNCCAKLFNPWKNPLRRQRDFTTRFQINLPAAFELMRELAATRNTHRLSKSCCCKAYSRNRYQIAGSRLREKALWRQVIAREVGGSSTQVAFRWRF